MTRSRRDGQVPGCTLALLFCFTAVLTSQGAEWIDVSSEQWKFTASFPGAPVCRVHLAKDVSAVEYAYETDGPKSAYSVYCADYGVLASLRFAAEGGLEEVENTFKKQAGEVGEVTATRSMKVSGYAAREIESTLPKEGKTYSTVVRIVFAGTRLYVGKVSEPDTAVNFADRKRFLDSMMPGITPKSKPDELIRVESVIGRFKAELPAEPKSIANNGDTLLECRTQDGETYSIAFQDLQNLTGGFDERHDRVDRIRRETLDACSGILITDQPFFRTAKFERVILIKIEKSDDGPLEQDLRPCYSGNRLYVLRATLKSVDGKLPREDMKKRFFQSFERLEKGQP